MENKKNTIVIILLVIIILILTYVAFLKPQNANKNDVSDNQITTNNNIPVALKEIENTNSPVQNNVVTTAPQNNVQVNQQNPNLISKTNWGINFTKGPSWNVTSNTSDKIILTQQDPGSVGDTIIITNVFSSTITDTDAKFGNVTYYYDSNTTKFMKSQLDEATNTGQPIITPAVATMYTGSGLPVFLGTGRWKTYIIPISHTQFLKLNIGGGGFSQPLTDLVKTI